MKSWRKVFVSEHNPSLRPSCRIFSLVNTVCSGNGSFHFLLEHLSMHCSLSRSSHPNIPELCTTFSLSDFNVEQQPVYVEVTIPNNVPLQEPFQINYRIHNRSSIVHEYKVILEQINLIVAVAGNTVVRRGLSVSSPSIDSFSVADIFTGSTA